MTYAVKEIFYALQGEGADTGRPAVFWRFTGCATSGPGGSRTVIAVDRGVGLVVWNSYGRLRREVKLAGCPIGSDNLLIAAHALSLAATLVSINVWEFSRIDGLRVQQWG